MIGPKQQLVMCLRVPSISRVFNLTVEFWLDEDGWGAHVLETTVYVYNCTSMQAAKDLVGVKLMMSMLNGQKTKPPEVT